MTDRLKANRDGKLTDAQRAPIVAAATISSIGFVVVTIFGLFTVFGFAQTLALTGIVGIVLMLFTAFSFLFLIIVLYTNAEMFVPEAIGTNTVRWQRGKLKIKMADRDRPEMPFVYIIGDYSFAPFVAPRETPLDKGREYLVYYSARSRLLLSIVPTDIPDAKAWMPKP